ncbi:RNA polymerase III transcription factor IIIC subunit-domain-containing protein [Pyronema domesticum]|uniref:Similar to Transcription factor tau subunit sfc1 acc. no. O14229 n=1 Tax=Pyronema omphalodes (strain CBS 100304) TaxID=1076935 RepID=U4L248_PYROM|nr:RNA polymerase III transcription factor IIIC subunit-domain-containing protein [Pyronema domesticum]CCX09210.1 Similar to Transcription factor tau subunit sfc1; acc. no. O14229 [Pyronema omphalodes CBS 100304]
MSTAPAPSTSKNIPSAPWITVPDKKIICIEHPAIIRNVEKGIATLGGEEALQKLAASNGNMALHLRFRPEDPMQAPIESRSVPTKNLLLKITIPKRRRKRKSGESGASTTKPEEPKYDSLLERIQASNDNYKVEAIGMIDKTVRFRDMANFQWNLSRSAFVEKLKDKFGDATYEKIQEFQLSDMRADPNSEILPPPLFSNTVIPHTYNFRQNPAVKRALIDGKTKLLNFQAAPKTLTPMVHISIADIPEKPTNIPSYESLDSLHKECVDNLRALFDQRPIWTRRALYNNFPKHLQTLVRFAMAHVAYMWRAGPWRDTCVLYGLDPRNDPKYRIYQSVFFQIETNKSRPSYPTHHNINEASHIFDGKRLIRDGRCFQLCDVTDPLLVQIINTESLRKSCDPTDGWYRHSTLTKIKSIMKAKIQGIAIGKPLTDADCLPILEQESEDEEQEAERKRKDERDREMRAEKRRKAVRYFRHPGENTAVEESVAGEEAQDGEAGEAVGEDGEEEDADGEWDEELELPQTQGEVDGKVKEMMAMLGRGDIGFDDDLDDEEDFDVLGGDEDDGDY